MTKSKLSGLVIKTPWIDLIIAGKKTWEIRGCRTEVNRPIALIQSGTGLVIGACALVECRGPLALPEMKRTSRYHRIKFQRGDALPYHKTYAWILNDAVRFVVPVPYTHPRGAVIWVNLTQHNVEEFKRLQKLMPTVLPNPSN